MYLEHLSLINFKNLEEVDLALSPNLNCFIGNNGVGKTNLMDAIYYLSFCKSFLNSMDMMNIRHNEDFFVIQGKYRCFEQEEQIYCGVKSGQKKQFKRNKKDYNKLAEHIGLLPLVIITPSDIDLINGISEERRKFIDSLISQYDQVYLDNLIRYHRALAQRNKLLKQMSVARNHQEDQLEVWDDQLVHYGNLIHEKRSEYIRQLEPVFQMYYELISGGKEKISLVYQSQLNDSDFKMLLDTSLKKDMIVQFTTAGIHKDDIHFNMGSHLIKKLGSQGQKKTYLIALKLAQFEFIKKMSEQTPILLLDDIFDKLDALRVKAIVTLVAEEQFGQIFITDTNREHLDSIIREVSVGSKIFVVEDGTIKETSHEKE